MSTKSKARKDDPAVSGPSVIPLLSRALQKVRSTPPRIIASPQTQPRRAAVALILRVVPSATSPLPKARSPPPTLPEFFEQDWVNDPGARAEILYLRRDKPQADGMTKAPNTGGAGEAHVAFPGGRMEDADEGGLYTAMRQTWEEIGVDLAEQDFLCVGQLDDREITTSLGKRLLMILSPFVFLQLTPSSASADPIPNTTLHWVPLSVFTSKTQWSNVTVDASSRLAPRHSTALRLLVRALVGTMKFPAIVLPVQPQDVDISQGSPTLPVKRLDEKRVHIEKASGQTPPQPTDLKLWGLSLGMTLDLITAMTGPVPLSPPDSHAVMGVGLGPGVAPPSLTSVFPRFSYPDVNFWIWVFGKRYREVIRGWEVSVRAGGTNDRRINWTGSALTTFYASVRKALILVIVARALGILFGLAFSAWWIFFRP